MAEPTKQHAPIPIREQRQVIVLEFGPGALSILQSLLAAYKVQSATLKRIERKVDKLMAEVDDAATILDGITREVGQIVPFIRDLIAKVEAGATDKALAAMVREKLPALQTSVTALDEFTPEPPPPPAE